MVWGLAPHQLVVDKDGMMDCWNIGILEYWIDGLMD